MAVRHLQCLGVSDVDLLLPRPPFALGILDRNASACEAVAKRPHVDLFLGGLQNVVILDVVARCLEIAVALLVRHFVRVVEQEEFQFRGHVGLHLHRFEALQLLLQHCAGAMRHIFMGMVVKHVAKDERRAGKPWCAAQRLEVRLQHEIAIALVPARRLVTRHRFHLDIDAEQIVAAVCFLIAAVDEKLGMEALADETALQVHHRRHHRIDGARRHFGLQLLEAQHTFAHDPFSLSLNYAVAA